MSRPSKNPKLEEEDYYFEHGFMVFTERYLLKRGSCCKSGCRHCPYGYKYPLAPRKEEQGTPEKL